ncbi:MAG TPA: hypothetical protein PLY87_17155, partial [Planctomycetaceae bacterium]|nr:hypothetical protein [Planctomycetaceae bacterium]
LSDFRTDHRSLTAGLDELRASLPRAMPLASPYMSRFGLRDGQCDRFFVAGSDPEVSNQAQGHERDADISGWQWDAHYHGWNDAAVLAK